MKKKKFKLQQKKTLLKKNEMIENIEMEIIYKKNEKRHLNY